MMTLTINEQRYNLPEFNADTAEQVVAEFFPTAPNKRALARFLVKTDPETLGKVLPKVKGFTEDPREACNAFAQKGNAEQVLKAVWILRHCFDSTLRCLSAASKEEPEPKGEPKGEPEPKPEPKAEEEEDPIAKAARDLLDAVASGGRNAKLTAEDRQSILDELAQHVAKPTVIEVVDRKEDRTVKVGLAHAAMPLILKICEARVPLWLVGPAGGGKTTMAKQVADAFGLPFFPVSCSPVTMASAVIGMRDATRWNDGPLVKAMREGGVYLGDEADNLNPSLAPMHNSALANRWIGLPTGEVVTADPKTVFIAGANTFGTGATDGYKRQQQDAATMDRFLTLRVDYDESLEAAMMGIERAVPAPDYSVEKGGLLRTKDAWFNLILKVRKALEEHKIQHVVSPRATKIGIDLGGVGVGTHWLLEGLVYKGLKRPQREKVEASCVRELAALTD